MTSNSRRMFEYVGWPGVITFLSLGAGWVAMLLSLIEQPLWAIISITVAFLLDCLDGYLARRWNRVSEFGRQLDGSVDFFNYIVFSAVFSWRYLVPGWIGAAIGLFILITGVYRLIRFNIEGFVENDGNLYYEGIVVCHLLLSIILLFLLSPLLTVGFPFLASAVILMVGGMQVSRFRVRKTGSYRFWLSVACLLLITCLILLHGYADLYQ